MIKVTDESYRLPMIEAFSSSELFERGTTLPMAIRGVDTTTGERGQFVVKFKNQNRMTRISTAFEYLGAWMANELNLNTVEAVCVNISEDFISTLAGRDGYKAAHQSSGSNFGSKYVPGIMQIPTTGFKLTKKQINHAKQIFVFDLFIQNIDRGHQRPNVGLNDDRLIIYDHELAFSFLRMPQFLRNKTPWVITPADFELYNKHFFYNYLKGLEMDFSSEVDALNCFNHDFWNSVERHIPAEFKVDELNEIKNCLLPFQKHRNEFAESIHKIMTL